MTIEERIEQLDPNLFVHVHTTTPVEDQRSLLALQTVMRRTFSDYIYMEIGSYMGGTLQPHIVDGRCAKIISIDPRPGAVPDVRGTCHYTAAPVQDMIAALQKIPGADVGKLKTFEASVSGLNPAMIGVRPQLCFVDGEHTDEAALADGRFCLSTLADNGIIAFHDANLVFKGLQRFLQELPSGKRAFRAHLLPNFVFLVEFGNLEFCEMEPLRQRVRENYKAYLAGMAADDHFRKAYRFSMDRGINEVRQVYERLLRPILRKVKHLFFKPTATKT